MGFSVSVKRYVYGLRFNRSGHEFDGLIRYVGSTCDLRMRFHAHRSKRSPCRAVAAAMVEHGRDAFELVVLETVTAETDHDAKQLSAEVEARRVAEFATSTGPHGLNLTKDGKQGNFVDGLAQEINQKRVAGIRARHEDEVVQQGYRDRMRKLGTNADARKKATASLRKRFEDTAFRKAHADRLSAMRSKPGWQERHAEVIAEIAKSPEVQAKKSASVTAAFRDPNVKARHLAAIKAREANPVARVRRALGLARRYVKEAGEKGLPTLSYHKSRVAELEAELSRLV